VSAQFPVVLRRCKFGKGGGRREGRGMGVGDGRRVGGGKAGPRDFYEASYQAGSQASYQVSRTTNDVTCVGSVFAFRLSPFASLVLCSLTPACFAMPWPVGSRLQSKYFNYPVPCVGVGANPSRSQSHSPQIRMQPRHKDRKN
jgi:hypothetical protein